MGKSLAEEMKRCEYSADDTLYEVENAIRELLRQICLTGMAEFLGGADDELHEKVNKKQPPTMIFLSLISSYCDLECLRQGQV